MAAAALLDHAGADLAGVGSGGMLAHVLGGQFNILFAGIGENVVSFGETNKRWRNHDLDGALVRHQACKGTEKIIRLLGCHVHLPVGGDDGLADVDHGGGCARLGRIQKIENYFS